MDYLFIILSIAGVYVMIAYSTNLITGFTGLVTLSQAAFVGIGAYTTALLMVDHGWNFFLSILAAVIITGIIGFIFGLVLGRLRGEQYMLATLGTGVIIFALFRNLESLTRGPFGIPGITDPELFGFSFSRGVTFFILVVITVVILYVISKYIVNSSFGRVLIAIREDEDAVQVFGYKTHWYKLAVWTIAVAIAGIAGSFWAVHFTFIDPIMFLTFESLLMITAIIIGGMGDLRGSIIGGIFITVLFEAVRFIGLSPEIAGHVRLLIFGLVLTLVMMFRPQGIIGKYKLE